ncbi:MAG: CPBP family intramembrane metalloprotease [Ardenticatenaceae bacterium]|nr:CPBP family intramembrane metalloprotease [Ardenticatenaceae bacterium]
MESLIIIILMIIGIIVLTNTIAATQNASLLRLFDRMVMLFHLPFLLVGAAFLLLPGDTATTLADAGMPLDNFAAVGLILIGIMAWATAVSQFRVRQFMARWLPLNPSSPVHTLALVLSAWLVANTFITLTQGGLQELANTTQSATLSEVVLQQGMFVLLAIFGVGLLVRRQGHAISDRLGLGPLTAVNIRFGIRWIIILVIVQWAIGALWMLTNPEQSALVDGISGELFGDFDTVWEWFVLALAAGMGEELLFRGALQPVFGMWFTAVLFAIAHVQYGFTLITLAVFIIGAALGYIRQRTNTSVAIFVHFGYNFVLGLLSLLAVYLERFIQ